MTDEELIEILDELVHDAKASEAAEINNEGIAAQLAYLRTTREKVEARYA